jgi:peptide/nickel transport system substrate-binding protein
VRWHQRRALQLGASVAVVAMVAVGCSSSSKNSTSNTTKGGGGGSSSVSANGPCPGDPPNQIYSSNSGGTPQTGHTLTVLGQGDVDENLDINIGYYTLDYLAYDLYNRPLYTYPSIHCQTYSIVPDIATSAPVVSKDGLKYQVTIRTGAMWDTNPPRQVNAADVVRGVKRSCNPNTPFNGQPDFADVLAGYATFCAGFAKVSSTSASAMADYINANNISGVQVDPSNPLTVDFTLTQKAAYFPGVLSLPPFNPAPVESLQSVPASATAWQTVYSDGPYKIQSYSPGKSIVFVRNLVWNQSVDPIDHAYVDQINISETGNQAGIYQEILSNSPQADLMWDVHVPQSDVPGLVSSKDPRLQVISESAANPWLVFNTVSPNNGGALGKVQVRQALSYAIDRTLLIQDGGGPTLAPALTHIIAPGTDASTHMADFYPYDPNKAKQMLAAAGASHLTLTFLYRQSVAAQKDFQTLQNLFSQIGVTLKGIGVPSGTFYGKYMNPGTPAKQGAWDIADAGWGPDWFPNGAKSWFLPTLDGNNLPPNSSNYGFFNDPTLNNDIQQALAASTEQEAIPLWQAADKEAMDQAALFPVYDPNEASIAGSQVHNCIEIQPLQNCNLANVWLSS